MGEALRLLEPGPQNFIQCPPEGYTILAGRGIAGRFHALHAEILDARRLPLAHLDEPLAVGTGLDVIFLVLDFAQSLVIEKIAGPARVWRTYPETHGIT
jgi:hypothetical protein